MVGFHSVEQRAGVRSSGPDQRPQTVVFTVVMVMKEVHHPQAGLGDGGALILVGGRVA